MYKVRLKHLRTAQHKFCSRKSGWWMSTGSSQTGQCSVGTWSSWDLRLVTLCKRSRPKALIRRTNVSVKSTSSVAVSRIRVDTVQSSTATFIWRQFSTFFFPGKAETVMFLPINCFYKKGCFSKVFEFYFNVKEQTQIVSVPLYQQEGRAVYSDVTSCDVICVCAAASRLFSLDLTLVNQNKLLHYV